MNNFKYAIISFFFVWSSLSHSATLSECFKPAMDKSNYLIEIIKKYPDKYSQAFIPLFDKKLKDEIGDGSKIRKLMTTRSGYNSKEFKDVLQQFKQLESQLDKIQNPEEQAEAIKKIETAYLLEIMFQTLLKSSDCAKDVMDKEINL